MHLAKDEGNKPGYRSRDGKRAINLAVLSRRFARALERESRHILSQSAQGKLDKNTAADLVNYVKLLKNLQEEEKDSIGKLSEDDLIEALDKKKTAQGQNT